MGLALASRENGVKLLDDASLTPTGERDQRDEPTLAPMSHLIEGIDEVGDDALSFVAYEDHRQKLAQFGCRLVA